MKKSKTRTLHQSDPSFGYHMRKTRTKRRGVDKREQFVKEQLAANIYVSETELRKILLQKGLSKEVQLGLIAATNEQNKRLVL